MMQTSFAQVATVTPLPAVRARMSLLSRVVLAMLLFAGLLSAGAVAESSTAEAASNKGFHVYCEGVRPSFGWKECKGSGTLTPGYNLRITNQSSGRRSVVFRVYNLDGSHLLGESGTLDEGEKGFIWRNDTNKNITVYFTVNVSGTGGSGVNVNADTFITRSN